MIKINNLDKTSPPKLAAGVKIQPLKRSIYRHYLEIGRRFKMLACSLNRLG